MWSYVKNPMSFFYHKSQVPSQINLILHWTMVKRKMIRDPAHWFVWSEKNKKSNFGFGLWEGVLPDPYLISDMANWLSASENVIFYPHEASKLGLIWKILQKCHFWTTIFVPLSKILRVRESTRVSSSVLMWDTIIYPVEGSQAVRIGARPKNVTFWGVNRGN